jgi:hypothetical protein
MAALLPMVEADVQLTPRSVRFRVTQVIESADTAFPSNSLWGSAG